MGGREGGGEGCRQSVIDGLAKIREELGSGLRMGLRIGSLISIKGTRCFMIYEFLQSLRYGVT